MRNKLFIAGIIGPIFYFLLMGILGWQWEGYSFLSNHMSELGGVESPYGTFMNVFGFMLLGVFFGLFGYAFYGQMEKNFLSLLVFINILIAGFFMVIVGFFPCDAGCVDVTLTGKLHTWTSIPQSITLPLAVILASFVLLKDSRFGINWSIFSIGLGSLSFLSGIFMSFSGLEDFVGIIQRIGIGTSLFWIVVISIKFLIINIEKET